MTQNPLERDPRASKLEGAGTTVAQAHHITVSGGLGHKRRADAGFCPEPSVPETPFRVGEGKEVQSLAGKRQGHPARPRCSTGPPSLSGSRLHVA